MLFSEKSPKHLLISKIEGVDAACIGNSMPDFRKVILFGIGLGSFIMAMVGLSQLPQPQPTLSDSATATATATATANSTSNDVILSRGFLIAMIGSGLFIGDILFYAYFFTDICHSDEDIIKEVNVEIQRVARIVPFASAPVPVAPVPVAPVQYIKPILKAPRAPVPFAPVPFAPVPIYGNNAQMYKKSIAQRYPYLHSTV